jgi:hypothetical protein
MIYELENCIEGYRVRERQNGLGVSDKDDNFVCELEGYSLSDFKDEWGKVDEDELYEAIREEERLNDTMKKLAEMA